MSMPYGNSIEDADSNQPPRKIRKGTRSCWNCKHRKVRCIFDDGSQNCRECLARGSACQSQEMPEPLTQDRTSLNERVGRVEQLLERVLSKLDGEEGDRITDSATQAVESPDNTLSPPVGQDTAPILSLFDNTVLGRRENGMSSSAGHTPETTSSQSQILDRRLIKLRRDLLSLFPSQSDLDKLAGAGNAWWLQRKQSLQDPSDSLLPIPLDSLRRSHPVTVAKSLLYVAISLQQLPPNFDTNTLQLRSPAELLQRISSLVSFSVLQDEGLICNMDGLECLILQGIIHNNVGHLKSCWLYYRRAINTAQLIGLHRPIAKWSRVNDPAVVNRANIFWWHMLNADRYTSLQLGFHYCVSDAVCNIGEDEGNITQAGVHMRRLYKIAGAIIDRNQTFAGVDTAMVRLTHTIDAELESYAAELTFQWWAVPTELPTGKTTEAEQCYSKLMIQYWHHQLEALLHLPLMLHAASERKYVYSKQTCLRASRRMITCYLALRTVTMGGSCSKSLDFQAFTAAVTLLVNLLGASGDVTDDDVTRTQDWYAVGKVEESLQQLSRLPYTDKVATQALNVLRVLKNVGGQGEPFNNGQDQTKLVIPYFGTIQLESSKIGPMTPSGPAPAYSPNAQTPAIGPAGPAEATSQPDVPMSLSVHAHSGSAFPAWDFNNDAIPDSWLLGDGLSLNNQDFSMPDFGDSFNWGLGL